MSQAKPFNAVPKIDSANPLAQGLSTYCYDTGSSIVDLVNGGKITTVGVSASQPSPVGPGLQFPLNGYGFMPPLPPGNAKFGGAVPYSAVMGTFFTGFGGPGVPDCGCISIQDAANSEDTFFSFNTWPSTDPTTPNNVSCCFNNSTNGWFHTPIIPGTFQIWGVTVDTNSTATLYYNGAVSSAYSGPTTFSADPVGQVMYNTAITTGQSFGNSAPGSFPFFSMWAGRALSQSEHLQMAQTPYGFLVGLASGYLIAINFKVLGVSRQIIFGVDNGMFATQADAVAAAVANVTAIQAAKGNTITNIVPVVSQTR